LIIGLLIGLLYGIVSQTINPLVLGNIPLYQPQPGGWVMIVLFVLGGGSLGLLAAWPEEVIPGVILSSLVGVLGSSLLTIWQARSSEERLGRTIAVLIFTLFPRALLFAPISALTRWVLGIWERELQEITFSYRKLAASLVLVAVLALAAGAFELYPRAARQALVVTHELIQAGLGAADFDSLPPALKPVDGFIQRARGSYVLLLSDNPDLLPVQRPMNATDESEYVVFVRFESGFRFGCAFTPGYAEPSCGEY
jgi:hypothetical protein